MSIPQDHPLLLVRRRAHQPGEPEMYRKLEKILPGLQDHGVERAEL